MGEGKKAIKTSNKKCNNDSNFKTLPGKKKTQQVAKFFSKHCEIE